MSPAQSKARGVDLGLTSVQSLKQMPLKSCENLPVPSLSSIQFGKVCSLCGQPTLLLLED